MAWIEQFTVTGLAGRPGTIERRLDRHVNVFWGLNGAGKTTLLKILHAAMNNDANELDELPFEEAEVVFRVGNEDGRVVRRYSKAHEPGEIEDDSGEVFMSADPSVDAPWRIESEHPASWDTSWDDQDLTARVVVGKFRHSYLPITRVSESRRRGVPSPDYAGAVSRYSTDDIFVDQVRDRWRDYAIKSTSRIRDIQQQGLATVLAILFGGFRSMQASVSKSDDVGPEEAYRLVQTFLREQNLPLVMSRRSFVAQFVESPTHRQVVSEIQDVRRQTDEVLLPQREFQRIIDSMYAGDKHLVLSSPRFPRAAVARPIGVQVNDTAIPLKSLSSGEKQLLQILLEALGASDETVMIDEPELSLHVVWQRELVDSMRRVNGGCQLLLATHSPEIMAGVSNSSVFEL